MGLSILSIMLFHQCFTSSIPFNVFHNYGYWGVDIFLFLSGMGLVKSLNNNSLKIYYLHRFNRIIPSCVLCGSLKYCIYLLYSSLAVLKDGLNLGIWSIMSLDLWFIPAIMILYTVSPILYYLIKKWTLPTITIITFVFLINGVLIRPKVGYDWLSPIGIFAWTIERLPVFVAGMYITMKKGLIDQKFRYSFPFLFISILLVLLEKTEMTIHGIQAVRFLTLLIGMPSLIYLCIIIIRKLPNKAIIVINFFGTYSLELYLVHEFIFWSLKVSYNNTSSFLLLFISFMLSCVTAYTSKLMSKKISQIILPIFMYI